jgi:hypothetical protein
MAARLWTALLVLAAVFAMHGVQCTTAAGGAGHAATPAGHAATSAGHAADSVFLAMTALTGHGQATATAGIGLADPISAARLVGHGDSVPAAPVAGAAVVMAAAGHGGAPHDAAGHLWTVCLAVLAAALAVLLASLVPRSVRLTPPALGCVRARLPSLAPPRPPDLSALCLLRI